MSAVGIVGLGLIGGSLARDLAAAGRRVLAVDSDPRVVAAATRAGIVAEDLDPHHPPPLVVLAVPVLAIPDWIRQLARVAEEHPTLVVTDTGSTKRSALAAAARTRLRFVGSHPVAGSHESGWDASRAGLFQGADVWVCADPSTDVEAVAQVEALWRSVGGHTRHTTAAEHDRLLARSSHLPQVTASALGRALAHLGVTADDLGTGGHDTTRLAASDAELWTQILMDNGDEVVPALDALRAELDLLLEAIAGADVDAVRSVLTASRAWKENDSGANG